MNAFKIQFLSSSSLHFSFYFLIFSSPPRLRYFLKILFLIYFCSLFYLNLTSLLPIHQYTPVPHTDWKPNLAFNCQVYKNPYQKSHHLHLYQIPLRPRNLLLVYYFTDQIYLIYTYLVFLLKTDFTLGIHSHLERYSIYLPNFYWIFQIFQSLSIYLGFQETVLMFH